MVWALTCATAQSNKPELTDKTNFMGSFLLLVLADSSGENEAVALG